MDVSIVIPAYRRPLDLKRCMDACLNQTIMPREIIVTVRDFDRECRKVIASYSPKQDQIKSIILDRPGQMRAWFEGAKLSRGDIVAFTDDDGEPRRDWVEKLIDWYRDPEIGGVGGCAINYMNGVEEKCFKRTIGRFFWYGKLTGFFQCDSPNPCVVDHLRGANMSYRRSLLTEEVFDLTLAGREYRNDTQVSMAVKNKGTKLVFDPAIRVNHHLGQQFEEGGRGINKLELTNNGINTTYVVLKYSRGFKKIAFLLYNFIDTFI